MSKNKSNNDLYNKLEDVHKDIADINVRMASLDGIPKKVEDHGIFINRLKGGFAVVCIVGSVVAYFLQPYL